MPRQPEFDRAEVLDSALDLFWSVGYEASSISKLLDAMELNRGSLYAAFGGKSALYTEVIDHYLALFRQQLYGPTLESVENPKQAIGDFFQQAFIEPQDPGKLANGCLLLNAISSLNKTEPELANKANDAVKWIRGLILARLVEAQQQGDIAAHKNPAGLADYLIALLAGLRTLCQSGSNRDTLQEVIDTGLSPVFQQ